MADMELAILMDAAGRARKIWHPGFRGRARGGPRVLLDSAGADVARKCVQGFAAI